MPSPVSAGFRGFCLRQLAGATRLINQATQKNMQKINWSPFIGAVKKQGDYIPR